MSSGVPEELEGFCAMEYRRVLGTLALMTGRLDVAEELAQEAFVQVCRHWERVRGYDAPGAWVTAVTWRRGATTSVPTLSGPRQ